jgi:hypothetical protein
MAEARIEPEVPRSRWVFRLAVLAMAIFILVLASNAAVDMLMSTLITGTWLILGLWWLVLTWRWFKRGRPKGSTNLDVIAAPIVVIMTIGVMLSGYPLELRFDASRKALQEIVADQRSSEHVDLPQRASWYDVINVESFGDELRLYVGRAYIFDAWGFSYSPTGSLSSEMSARHHHIEGPWYTFVEHHGS